jgi:hypothetical protein
VLLGNTPGSREGFAYGTVTRYGRIFQDLPLPTRFLTPRQHGSTGRTVPRPRMRNACRLSHAYGLASSPFAHHYSGNRGCFLFLRVLRCFTSPRYHQPPYAFRRRRRPMTAARFPHSETPGSKPGCRLPGEYRRLQRPSSAPGTKASTVCPKKLGTYTTNKHNYSCIAETGDARVHCAVLKKQTEPGRPNPASAGKNLPAVTEDPATRLQEARRPFPQDPTACPLPAGPALPVPRPPAGGTY